MKNNDSTDKNLRTMLDIIKYPVISDKSTRLLERNTYTFMVDKRANKFTIKKVIEFIFDVNIIKINTLLTPRKPNDRLETPPLILQCGHCSLIVLHALIKSAP